MSPDLLERTTPAGVDPDRSYPAPWTLTGEGIIFPVLAKKDYNREHAFLDESEKQQYRGGLGSVRLVNYHSSDVGPYQELLYIPGNFRYQGRSYKRVSKIYVSTHISVREGIAN